MFCSKLRCFAILPTYESVNVLLKVFDKEVVCWNRLPKLWAQIFGRIVVDAQQELRQRVKVHLVNMSEKVSIILSVPHWTGITLSPPSRLVEDAWRLLDDVADDFLAFRQGIEAMIRLMMKLMMQMVMKIMMKIVTWCRWWRRRWGEWRGHRPKFLSGWCFVLWRKD